MQFSVLWHVRMILIHQRGKSMLHKCLKDANNTKAPWLMSLGRIFITDCSNQDKQCSVLFFFWYMPSGFHRLKITLFLAWYFVKTSFWSNHYILFLSLKKTPWLGFKIPLVVSLYLLSLPTYIGPADNDCHYSQFPSLNVAFPPPCRLGTLLFCRELMSSSSLFPILSFLPCGFLVINTGIGSNSSSATLSEPSGTSKPEMRLLSSAA